MNKQIISAHELARKVIATYERGDGELITGIEFHNSENCRTKHRININGTLECKLYMQHEFMSPAAFNIYIAIYDGTWSLKTTGYYDEVNVSYSSTDTEMQYTFLQLKEWINDFTDTVCQLKAQEVHGFVIVP